MWYCLSLGGHEAKPADMIFNHNNKVMTACFSSCDCLLAVAPTSVRPPVDTDVCTYDVQSQSYEKCSVSAYCMFS